MFPFGIGLSEIIVIAIVILLVVGPNRLPEVARTVGKGLRTVRKASSELRETMQIDEIKRELMGQPEPPWRKKEPIEDVHAEVQPKRQPPPPETDEAPLGAQARGDHPGRPATRSIQDAIPAVEAPADPPAEGGPREPSV